MELFWYRFEEIAGPFLDLWFWLWQMPAWKIVLFFSGLVILPAFVTLFLSKLGIFIRPRR